MQRANWAGRTAAVLIAATAVAAAVAPARGQRAAAPPGATARCRDGTYSFSHHHAGTCSHHGGVAAWLDGTGGAAGGSPGRVILIRPQTRTGGCTLAPEPDRRCTPG